MPVLLVYGTYIEKVTINPDSGLSAAQHVSPQPPPVVVDLDLDDVPDTTFSTYRFSHTLGNQVIVVTLGLDSDHLLASFSEWAKEGDVYDLYARMFEHTTKSITYRDGTDINVEDFFSSAGLDIDEIRQLKLDDYREWMPEKVRRMGSDWLPELGPSDILNHLMYEKTISLTKLSQAAQAALAQWSDELTDTSMRPQRLSRRERRASARQR